MYTARAVARPKLTVSISAAQNASRPSLSLKSPGPLPRTPISPSAASPSSARFSSLQVPNYHYSNSCSSKSILKKQTNTGATAVNKRIQFKGTPTVHCVTPIENPEEYYGTYTKLSREERRWTKDLREEHPEYRGFVFHRDMLLASVPAPDSGLAISLQHICRTACGGPSALSVGRPNLLE
ncbi:hypothetical protein BDV25DRAFT_142459 [Aspergillus avenaceus]|uniref:Uncharacterized protein n=1 Tax=Aspergillus avenaceus TaxID=36643 RepID=A0A5N6TN66_ASPAV|nr:hypothetical protein BDV25DRAFT_142459 [Aspergillus avenaceus]